MYRLLPAAALAATITLFTGVAHAHGVAGPRFFPATIATDDPAVADELSLPTISRLDNETEVSGEYSKRITPHLGFSVEGAWIRDEDGGVTTEGFQNVETTLKWQFFTSATHEAILAAGLSAEWGGSGAAKAGAEDTTTVTPTFYFGKGLGDLPASMNWLRPVAITGLVGYTAPTKGHDDLGDPIPSSVSGGVSVQYSLPYLAAQVHDNSWPTWVNQLTPLVEMTFERPVRHGAGEGTTGTINPGVLWSNRHFQLGAEAIIPINDESGDGVGWAVQAHFFLDDLFPRSLGRPIFGGKR